MKFTNAMLLADFYKFGHRFMVPDKTEFTVSTWTPRSFKHLPFVDKCVVAGIQGTIKEITEIFDDYFFKLPKKEVIEKIRKYYTYSLGSPNTSLEQYETLHDLGYLPLEFKGLDEGTCVPARVPVLTITNTDARFYWLPTYIETMFSCLNWKTSTAASIARAFRKKLDGYAMETVGNTDFVPFQGHDFSFRGLSGPEDASRTGFGHLLSFCGTDTPVAIDYCENYYNADMTKELIGVSVNATEHDNQTSFNNDYDYYNTMIERYPTGILSLVSDGRDYWKVLTEVIPSLKDKILARGEGLEGIHKLVVRGDSGDPVDILAGNPYSTNELERKGTIEILWDIFGGTISEKGYRILNPKIGGIYGDAITYNRMIEICERLKAKGFASINEVLGIGSYTYQYLTRDSLGYALKTVWKQIDGKGIDIFKDPVTDDGTKKSARGRVTVHKNLDTGEIFYLDSTTTRDLKRCTDDLLTTVFKDGKLIKETSLSEIRARLQE